MKKLFKRLLKPFKKARKQAPRVRYIQDGVVRYANIDRLTVATLIERVRQMEATIDALHLKLHTGDTIAPIKQSTSLGLQS